VRFLLFAKQLPTTTSLPNSGNRISQYLNDCLTTRFIYDGANELAGMDAIQNQWIMQVKG
jgi:hypothetical protein